MIKNKLARFDFKHFIDLEISSVHFFSKQMFILVKLPIQKSPYFRNHQRHLRGFLMRMDTYLNLQTPIFSLRRCTNAMHCCNILFVFNSLEIRLITEMYRRYQTKIQFYNTRSVYNDLNVYKILN